MIDAASETAQTLLHISADEIRRQSISLETYLPDGVGRVIEEFERQRCERNRLLHDRHLQQVAHSKHRDSPGQPKSSPAESPDDVELELVLHVPTGMDLLSDSPVVPQPVHIRARLETISFPGLNRPIHVLRFTRNSSASIAGDAKSKKQSGQAAGRSLFCRFSSPELLHVQRGGAAPSGESPLKGRRSSNEGSVKDTMSASKSTKADHVSSPLRASLASVKVALEPTLQRMRRAMLVVVAVIVALNIAVSVDHPVERVFCTMITLL